MKTDIYILLVQNFVKYKGVELEVFDGHENISLFSTIEKAFEAKDEAAAMIEEKGYKIVDSNGGDDSPFVYYWSRYKSDQNKAIVFTIICKTVEGELFSY